MIGKIYVLKDPNTNEIRYCGQTTKSLEYRLNGHIQDSKRYNHHTANWIKSLLKGGTIPIIELLEECVQENLNNREIFYISKLSKTCRLTNTQGGGRNGSFIKHNEEAKRKISLFMKNYKKSKEHIDKIKKSLSKMVYQYDSEGNFIRGYLQIDELREIGYDKSNINSACRREGTAYGYNWRFYKEDKIIPKISYYKTKEFREKIKITNHNRSKKI